MKLLKLDKWNGCELDCSYKRECAQHCSAGDFRLEDGFSPELVRIGEEIHCETFEKPRCSQNSEDWGFQFPNNIETLMSGFVDISQLEDSLNYHI